MTKCRVLSVRALVVAALLAGGLAGAGPAWAAPLAPAMTGSTSGAEAVITPRDRQALAAASETVSGPLAVAFDAVLQPTTTDADIVAFLGGGFRATSVEQLREDAQNAEETAAWFRERMGERAQQVADAVAAVEAAESTGQEGRAAVRQAYADLLAEIRAFRTWQAEEASRAATQAQELRRVADLAAGAGTDLWADVLAAAREATSQWATRRREADARVQAIDDGYRQVAADAAAWDDPA